MKNCTWACAPMRKRNILYVIENEFFGGGEQSFARIINGLNKAEYDVTAACLTGSINPASAAFTGKIGKTARILPLDLRRLVDPLNVLRLRRIISGLGINIVHSQGARANFYSRLAARSAGGVPVVSTVASPVEEYNVNFIRKAVYTALDRFGGSSVRFIAVADHIERKLARVRGISPEKITRIYNGVDATEYSLRADLAAKVRTDYNIAGDCFLVAAACRLSWEKGLFNLVEAAGRIAALGGGPAGCMRYIIAGEGPLGKDLKSAVNSAGLADSFIFTGFLDDVRPLLAAADVFALPSYREGFPMSVLEAMAAGKPVIASDIDGVNESVTDGLSGILVPARDSAALAAGLGKLFKDRAAAAVMGRRGREIVMEKFGLDRMIKAHEDLYRGLVKT